MLNLLVYTSLYPGKAGATHGIFVKELTSHIAKKLEEVKIVVPVDGRNKLNRHYLNSEDDTSDKETNVIYDTFWTIPKFFKRFDGFLMYQWTKRGAARLAVNSILIHSHYAYPDSEAARLLASKLQLPHVVTVHGSDINVIARDPAREKKIVNLLKSADAVISVSQDLLYKVKRLTGRNKGLFHIPNGIDEKKFFPADKTKAKRALNFSVSKKYLLFAGRLEAIKGIHLIIDALGRLPENISLIIVGTGSKKKELEKKTKEMQLVERIAFVGAVPHHLLHKYYQAADALILASYSEGWPTVILEAMACALPVISPNVGGVSEVLNDSRLGVITQTNAPETLAKAAEKVMSENWDTSFICRYAGQFTWGKIADQYISIYKNVLYNDKYKPSVTQS